MCLYKPNGEAVSLLYPRIVINSPDNMLTNDALYPSGIRVGKDKRGLSIGLSIASAKFKHKRNAIMQHQPIFKLHPVRLPFEPPLATEVIELTIFFYAVLICMCKLYADAHNCSHSYSTYVFLCMHCM